MSKNDPPKAVKQYWVTYCRKSTDDPQKQLTSIPDQAEENTTHYHQLSESERRGRPLKMLTEKRSAFIPNDPRKASTDKGVNRRVFQQLLEMADRGEVYGVIVSQFNRISRNHADTGAFVQRIVDGRICRLETSIDKRQYTAKDSNAIFMLGIEGGMGWKDSNDKGVLVLERMKKKAEGGKHMGRKPFGYMPKITINKDGRPLRETIEDPERIHYVKRMFELTEYGYTLGPLVLWAKKMMITNRRGKQLNKAAIAHILHDPYYKGFVRFLDKEHPWTDDPPVSIERWNRVQIILAANRTNTARPHELELRNLFKFGSMIRCGKCGRVLTPYRVKKMSGKLYIYYECKNPERCGVSIRQDLLGRQHGKIVTTVDLDKNELDRLRERLLMQHDQKSKTRNQDRERLQHEYASVEKKIRDQLRALPVAQEAGCESEAQQILRELKEERQHLYEKLQVIHEQGTQWVDQITRCFELFKMAQELLKYGSPRVREKVLRAIALNYKMMDGKLICELRSPFKEAFAREGCLEWWAIQDSNL